MLKITKGHLNINSIRSNFDLLKEMVTKEIGIMLISKTKLDEPFPL